MKLEDPPQERRRFELIAAAMAAVIGVTAVGFFVIVILSADEAEPAATPTLTATTAPATPTVQGVALTRPVELRSGPAPDVAIVTRLAETDAIRVLGRSPDGAWLVVGLRDRPEVTGWVPLDAVVGVETASLPVVEGPGAGGGSNGDGTLTPDLPDLVVARAFSRENQLWVEVTNQGIADATGKLAVSVNDGPAVRLDVKPGEPLRPGQVLEAAVPGHYVQLRTSTSVLLVPSAEIEEEDSENNTWEGIVGPDAPNDVEIAAAEIAPPDDHLVVVLRNNSPIPVAGTFTVSVREALPGTQLLGRQRATVELPPGGTHEVEFPELAEMREADLTRVRITLSTDAIDDADLGNNTYPR